MYCPIVVISPSLYRSVPSDDFSVIDCKSIVDIKVNKLIRIRECHLKGFLGYF